MKINKFAVIALTAPLALTALVGCGEDDKKDPVVTEGNGEAAEGEGEGAGPGPVVCAPACNADQDCTNGACVDKPAQCDPACAEGMMCTDGACVAMPDMGEGEGEGEMGMGEGEGEDMGEGEGEGEPPNPCVPGDLAATAANSPYAAGIDADNGVAVDSWVDRTGNPGVNTALIKLILGDEAAKAYNQTGAADWSKWGDEFAHVIWAYGCIDGVEGGLVDAASGGQLNAGAVGPLLANDVLTIDTAHPYADNGYLGYVDDSLGGMLGQNAPGGGRTLNQDVIKLTVLALAGADAYPVIAQDGDFPVDADGNPAWPYLAPAHVAQQ